MVSAINLQDLPEDNKRRRTNPVELGPISEWVGGWYPRKALGLNLRAYDVPSNPIVRVCKRLFRYIILRTFRHIIDFVSEDTVARLTLPSHHWRIQRFQSSSHSPLSTAYRRLQRFHSEILAFYHPFLLLRSCRIFLPDRYLL